MSNKNENEIPPRVRAAMNLYMHWAMFAVLGKLREADELLRVEGGSIRAVAKVLRHHQPVEAKPLHRGMLMEGAEFFDPSERMFASWSEDADVATWFADKRASINEYLAATYPNAKGFLLSLDGPPTNAHGEVGVLFHHGWDIAAELPGLAAKHPQIGEVGARQVEWALKTQKEVITEMLHPTAWPVLRSFEPTAENYAACKALDRRLTPPWIVAEWDAEEAKPPEAGQASLAEALSRVTAAIDSVPKLVASRLCQSPPFGCGRAGVTPASFRDDEARAEYEMSALCQACQDRVFGDVDDDVGRGLAEVGVFVVAEKREHFCDQQCDNEGCDGGDGDE